MRKTIKIYLFLCLILWIGTFIAIVMSGGLYHNYALVGCACFAFFIAFCTFYLLCSMTYSGLDRDWFKTQEKLDRQIEEANISWEKANKLIAILGEHEAIKLWNKNKKKDS